MFQFGHSVAFHEHAPASVVHWVTLLELMRLSLEG